MSTLILEYVLVHIFTVYPANVNVDIEKVAQLRICKYMAILSVLHDELLSGLGYNLMI